MKFCCDLFNPLCRFRFQICIEFCNPLFLLLILELLLILGSCIILVSSRFDLCKFVNYRFHSIASLLIYLKDNKDEENSPHLCC